MQLPNNIAFAVASAFAAAVSITAITNAVEAVATATNTFATGDFIEYTGGWSKANGRVFRLKAASSTSFTLEGLDTSDTSLFPVGAGVGTVRNITTWAAVTGVVSADIAGGESIRRGGHSLGRVGDRGDADGSGECGRYSERDVIWQLHIGLSGVKPGSRA